MALPNTRAILLGAVLLAASSAGAQTTQNLSGQRLHELRQWTRDYTEWKAWSARWRNRPEPGWFSSRARRQPPVPPSWLAEACASVLEDSGPLSDGCRAWREWQQDDFGATLIAEQMVATAADRERAQKSAWWEHVHLDAVWPMTQAGSSVYGLFGMHATIPLSNRVEVFVAPGAMPVRLPSRNGGQTWSAGADWGFSYRLFDFRMPRTRRPATIHFNAARVWVFGAGSLPVRSEMYLAGLSLTLRQSGERRPAR